MHTVTVTPADTGKRLDAVLAEHIDGVSRAQAQRLIDDGQVTLNDATAVRSSIRVQAGDVLTLTIPEAVPSVVAAQNIPLTIVYEDDDLLVIDKARGMAVHPAPGTSEGTLVNALLAHCAGSLSGIGGVERPGIVHRLDKDTTGLLMVAKNDTTHRALQAQIQARTAQRRYRALVWGKPPFVDAVIDAPLGRHSGDRQKMAVQRDGSGRDAVTQVHVDDTRGPISRITCTLQTGRTHQIRVHLQFAGFPVVGDPVYGGLRKSGDKALDARVAALQGQALHAFSLAFTHPHTGAPLAFESPLPAPFRTFWESL
jgi:23S rRNA pseudouridine1911/1915/1917 synthase